MKDQSGNSRSDANGGANESSIRLLEAAGELIIARGSIDVSLNDIARRSGVNAALVSYYFGNKAGMFMALLRRRLGPGVADLERLLEAPLCPADKLRRHVTAMVNTYFQYPYVNRLMHELTRDEKGDYGRLIAEEFSVPVANAQRAILHEGREVGVFREVDPLVVYFTIVGACDQLFHARHQAKHVFGIERIDEALKRRYVDGLCANIIRGLAPDNSAPQ